MGTGEYHTDITEQTFTAAYLLEAGCVGHTGGYLKWLRVLYGCTIKH